MRTATATLRLLPLVLSGAVSILSTSGANWPAWRGPEANGVCPEKQLPLRWSTNQNVRWRVALPGPGNSTPVIWENRVFVTQSVARSNAGL